MRKLAFIMTTLFMTMMFGMFIRPDVVTNMFDTMGLPLLLGIAGVRIAFGILLLVAAAASRWPTFLNVMGVVFICSGILVLLMGVDGVRGIVDSVYGDNVALLRAGIFFAFSFFGLIAFALMPGRDATGPDAMRAV